MNLMMLAQDSADVYAESAGEGGILPLIVMLLVMVVIFAGMWKVFSKAGEPGIACIIPIWNLIVMIKIAGRPMWWVILFLIPIVSIVVSIIVAMDIAKNFGKGAGFGLGLAFLPPIFYPILGFSDAEYTG